MGLTRLSLRRPVTVLMLLAGLVILGIVSYTQMPVRRLPSISFPHVTVLVGDPGASPETVRTQVLDPLENALSNIGGILTMTATARQGAGTIGLRFPGGTDVAQAATQVARAVDAMAGQLPIGVTPPVVLTANPNALPIMTVAVYGSLHPTALYDLVTGTLAPALEEVPGVAQVNVVGARSPQVNVDLLPSRLLADGVGVLTVERALAAANQAVPAGSLTSGGRSDLTRTSGLFTSVASIARMPLPGTAPARRHRGARAARRRGRRAIAGASGGHKALTVGQVATVALGYAPVTTVSRLNGQTAVSLVVTASSSANSLAVARGIRARLSALASTLPAGVHTAITGDLTTYTRRALSAVQMDLALALIATALMLLLFLHRGAAILIVLLSLPSAMISSLLVMHFLGFSLDTVSLMAISLLVGLLVDDAIRLLENIQRHLEAGRGRLRAVLQGRSELGAASLASTLADVVIWVPVAFMNGNIGQLFREFGLTIAIATVFSLIVSFSLTPMLAARWLDRAATPGRLARAVDALVAGLAGFAARAARRLVRRPHAALAASLATAALCAWIVATNQIPSTYTPPQNTGVFYVTVQMPTGTAVAQTDLAIERLAQGIRRLPWVALVLSTVGFGGGSVSSSNIGRLTVDLNPRGQAVPITTVESGVDRLARSIPGMKIQLSQPNPLVGGGGAPGLSVVLRGPSLATLVALSSRVERTLRAIPGVTHVTSTAQNAVPVLSVTPHRQLLARLGLSTRSVGQALHLALAGVNASDLESANGVPPVPIVIQVQGASSLDPAALAALPVAATPLGPATLGEVATLATGSTPTVVREYDRQLEVTLTANTSSIPLGTIGREARRALTRMGMPAGTSWVLNGLLRQQDRALKPLQGALGLALILVFMLLAALYESLADPVVVFLALPFAAAGALGALWVTGQTLNIFSWIALIMLLGLASKHAIVLVDRSRALERSGLPFEEAVTTACRQRVRPFLMTTATMVAAMTPLALHLGSGASDRAPMAIVLIGGLIGSAPMLLAVPAALTLTHRLRLRLSAWRAKAPAPAAPPILP